jgi:hypothetical protein
VTNYKNLVYVLNDGGSGNITGFRLSKQGQLAPLANSTRTLSNNGVGAAPGPAQIEFSPDGEVLVVTEKATNLIDTFEVDEDGAASQVMTHPSAGMTPFGFAFTRHGTLIVSEAVGGAVNASSASSYDVSEDGIELISAAVPTQQSAACWAVARRTASSRTRPTRAAIRSQFIAWAVTACWFCAAALQGSRVQTAIPPIWRSVTTASFYMCWRIQRNRSARLLCRVTAA